MHLSPLRAAVLGTALMLALACGGLPIDLPLPTDVVLGDTDANDEAEDDEGDAEDDEEDAEDDEEEAEDGEEDDGEDAEDDEEVQPRPRPRPDPRPDPVPAPEPEANLRNVRVEGPGTVVLIGGDDRRWDAPGNVPEGVYVIEVTFPGQSAVPTGKVKVKPTGATVRCNQAMGLCRGG